MSGLKGRYPVVLEQALIWRDIDAFQHINNATYFRYFEDARMACFERAGMLEHMEKARIGPILASTGCEFRAPLTYPDTIEIATRIKDLREKRFSMEYMVYSRGLDKIAAEGEGLIVYFDYAARRSCPVPEAVLDHILTLQPELAASAGGRRTSRDHG